MARGEFDNLPGKRKPLDLEAYFNTPEELRMAFAMLKSNEFVPEEVEMLKEIKQIRADVAAAADETEKAALTKKLNEKTLALTIALEKYKRKR